MRLAVLLLLCFPAFAQWASPGIGFDFRTTSGFVTDPSSTQYVCGSGDSVQCGGDFYPVTTTIGGVSVTWGWEFNFLSCGNSTNSGDSDRSSGIDPRIAGLAYMPPGACIAFRVDLPATGTYSIQMGIGDTSSDLPGSYDVIYDGTTSLWTVLGGATDVPGGQYADATGTVRTSAANWASLQTAKTLTFSTTTFRLLLGNLSASGYSEVSHIRIKQTSGGGSSVRRRWYGQ